MSDESLGIGFGFRIATRQLIPSIGMTEANTDLVEEDTELLRSLICEPEPGGTVIESTFVLSIITEPGTPPGFCTVKISSARL